jgi:hypothetical protein
MTSTGQKLKEMSQLWLTWFGQRTHGGAHVPGDLEEAENFARFFVSTHQCIY